MCTLPRFPQPITAIAMGASASPKSCGMVFALKGVEAEVRGSLKERRHALLILSTAGRGIAARIREVQCPTGVGWSISASWDATS